MNWLEKTITFCKVSCNHHSFWIIFKWGLHENCKGGVHICKLAYGDLTWEKLSFPKSISLWDTILRRVQVVSHIGNIWSGPWVNLPQYMDRTFMLLEQNGKCLYNIFYQKSILYLGNRAKLRATD